MSWGRWYRKPVREFKIRCPVGLVDDAAPLLQEIARFV